MCGIGGIINLSKKAAPIEYLDISIMKKMLLNRGPDAEGMWRSDNKNIVLLIQRLSTQDTRTLANQPCWSTDKSVVAIFNGEIYNHTEIKDNLINKGYKFFTRNDTEVIANAYHFWGKNFLNKIQGQFALVVFDKKDEKGIIARDEHGISPLFYSVFKEKFFFSSTPESILLQSKQSLDINKQAVSDFMIADCIADGNTFFNNIKYLKPGHFFEFKINKKIDGPKQFILPTDFLNIEHQKIKSENEYIEEIYNIIKKGVNSRVKGDKEVGIFLSGGLDSTIILALFRSLYPEKSIKTFTASFEDIESKELVGEHNNALNISKFYKSSNKTVSIEHSALLKSIGTFSQPSANILEFINQSIAREARKSNVEVALTGEGADEMFFGYDHNLALISNFKKGYNHLKKKYQFRSDYVKNINISKAKIEDIFLCGGADIDLDNNRKFIFSEEVMKTNSFKKNIKQLIDSFKLRNPQDVDKISVLVDFFLKVPELFLRRAEGPTMNEGVELRFPFLQKKLKDLLYQMPLNIKLGNEAEDKYLLRKIAKKLIPKKLIFPKLPIGVPATRKEYFKGSGHFFKKPAFKNFFHQNYSNMSEIIFNGKYNKLDLFNDKFLKKIVNQQSNIDTCYFDKSLWKIWNIALWYERLSN